MTAPSNYLSFCMDSLRYDMFMKAKAKTFHNFTDYDAACSRAGFTVPSIFASFMNEYWYESGNKRLIQDCKVWGWVPSDLQAEGFFTAFLSDNWFVKLYRPTFEKGFSKFIIYQYGTGIENITEELIKIYDEVEERKFIFVLTMETHQPYMIEGKEPEPKHTVRNQIRGVEYIDPFFKRILKRLSGTNTEITVFSDHGDLDPELEGVFGHGPEMFHRKLFEIPLGRRTI